MERALRELDEIFSQFGGIAIEAILENSRWVEVEVFVCSGMHMA